MFEVDLFWRHSTSVDLQLRFCLVLTDLWIGSSKFIVEKQLQCYIPTSFLYEPCKLRFITDKGDIDYLLHIEGE